ncbi:MAG: C1 family peptidase, partial [Bacteroidota bacterium]
EAEYTGKLAQEKIHDHREMEAVLKGMLDGLLKQKRLSNKWKPAFDAVLDAYLGEVPKKFQYQGREHTPQSLAKHLAINVDDYISITSFTHHPFYEKFILEIPDNYSNGSYYNVPLDELEAIVDHALGNGYSVAWDGDVSEKGFSSKKGMALVPSEVGRKNLFEEPGTEKKITQAYRQERFESFATTDDHLMHLVGISRDKNGQKYYLVKNSWGEVSEFKGFLHMSKAYFQLKSVSIMVHKAALPAHIAKKLL